MGNSMKLWWLLKSKVFSVTHIPLALIGHNMLKNDKKCENRDFFNTLGTTVIF